MLSWILANSVVAIGMTAICLVLCKWGRLRPAIGHCAWALVLVALLWPGFGVPGIPGLAMRDTIQNALWSVNDAESAAAPRPKALTSLANPDALQALVFEASRGQSSECDEDPNESRACAQPSMSADAIAAEPKTAMPPQGAWIKLLLWLWGLGSALAAWFQIRSLSQFQRIVRESPPAPPVIRETLADLATRLQIPCPQTRMIPGSQPPLVWAWGRPRLCWPAEWPSDINPGTLGVLGHELAHLRRRDHWLAWMELAGGILLWWHPLFHFARKRMRRYSELACDTYAIELEGVTRRSYAESLLSAATLSLRQPFEPKMTMFNAGRSQLELRLASIMSSAAPARLPRSVAFSAGLFLLLLLGLFHGTPLSHVCQNSTKDRADKVLTTARAWKQALRAHRESRLDDAEDHLATLTSIYPEHGAAWQLRGRIALDLGDVDRAVRCFRAQKEQFYRTPNANLYIAQAFAVAHRYDAALEALEEALRAGLTTHYKGLKHDRFKPMATLPRFQAWMKRAELATQIYDEAQEVWAKQDLVTAIERLTALRQYMPNSGLILHRLGYSLVTVGRLNQAGQVFAKQLETGWEAPSTWYNIACVHAKAGRTKTAATALQEACVSGFDALPYLERDPDLANLRGHPVFNRVLRSSRIDSVRQAAWERSVSEGKNLQVGVRMAKEALAADPEHREAHFWAALAWLRMGDTAKTREHIRQQLPREHLLGPTLFLLAVADATDGNEASAVEHLEDAAACGYPHADAADNIIAFNTIRQQTRFKAAVAQMREHKVKWKRKKASEKRRMEALDALYSDARSRTAMEGPRTDGG